MRAQRIKLLALIGFALLVLARVQVHVPACGTMPALAFAFCAELGVLAVIATGITRSLMGAT